MGGSRGTPTRPARAWSALALAAVAVVVPVVAVTSFSLAAPYVGFLDLARTALPGLAYAAGAVTLALLGRSHLGSPLLAAAACCASAPALVGGAAAAVQRLGGRRRPGHCDAGAGPRGARPRLSRRSPAAAPVGCRSDDRDGTGLGADAHDDLRPGHVGLVPLPREPDRSRRRARDLRQARRCRDHQPDGRARRRSCRVAGAAAARWRAPARLRRHVRHSWHSPG